MNFYLGHELRISFRPRPQTRTCRRCRCSRTQWRGSPRRGLPSSADRTISDWCRAWWERGACSTQFSSPVKKYNCKNYWRLVVFATLLISSRFFREFLSIWIAKDNWRYSGGTLWRVLLTIREWNLKKGTWQPPQTTLTKAVSRRTDFLLFFESFYRFSQPISGD